MEEFPSGQRGQTVNLLLRLRWSESILLHQKAIMRRVKQLTGLVIINEWIQSKGLSAFVYDNTRRPCTTASEIIINLATSMCTSTGKRLSIAAGMPQAAIHTSWRAQCFESVQGRKSHYPFPGLSPPEAVFPVGGAYGKCRPTGFVVSLSGRRSALPHLRVLPLTFPRRAKL